MNIPVADNIYTNPVTVRRGLKKNRLPALATALFLVLSYVGFCILRYWLTVKYSANPFILPDEMVYSNFGRSIYENFTIAMRNRPASYDNILYPLLLAPLYGLPPEADLFRSIQLLNTLLVNLAIFPAYALACRFTENRWLRVGIAFGALLMPDIVLSGRVMTECVTYPLFLLVVYLCCSSFEKNPAAQLLPAFVSLLLYMGKSGGVGLTLAYAAVLLIYGIRDMKKDRDAMNLKRFVAFFGSYLIMFGLFKLFMIYGLGTDYSLTNLYASQTNGISDTQLCKAAVGLALYSFYAVIGLGILFVLVPCCHWHDYEEHDRKRALFALLALGLYIISISWIFFGSEGFSGTLAGRIHTRYLFPFIPFFWCLAARPLPAEKSKLNTPMFVLLALAFVFLTVSGFDSLVSDGTMPVDAVLLSHISDDYAFIDLRAVGAHVYAFFILLAGWLMARYGWAKKSVRVLFGCFVAVTLIAANITGYDTNQHNTETELADDIKTLVQELDNDTVMLIGANNRYFDNHLSALDVSLRHSPYCIMVADMCEQLAPYGKLISEYETPQYWMEDFSQPIPQGTVLVFSGTSEQKLKFDPGADVKQTPNGYYYYVRPSVSGQVFKSVLAGVCNYVPQHNCAIWVFDEQVLSHASATVGMYVKSEAAGATGSFTISCGEDQSKSFNVDSSGGWVYFTVQIPSGATHLKLPVTKVSGDVMLVDFTIQ